VHTPSEPTFSGARSIHLTLSSMLLLASAIPGANAADPANVRLATADAPKSEQALAGNPEAQTLEEIIVTGSNIPMRGVSDVPVTVIGAAQIAESGVDTNVLELLRKTVPAFAGRSNAGNSNGSNTNQATGGGSQISLRNLPTLVLVNGRRVTYSSTNGSGGKNFVDINMFPIAAIERIEVLTDGASAIYGSDAVGGVVNIILKSDFDGVEVGGRYAVTDETGHYSERSGSIVYGAKHEAINFTVSLDWSKTDPLLQSQRPFISPDLRPAASFPGIVGGNYLSPGLNSPSQTNPVGANATYITFAPLIANGTYIAAANKTSIPSFDIAPYTSILLAQELKSATANFSANIIEDRLIAFGNAIYSKSTSSNQLATSLSNVIKLGITVPAFSPYNPVAANIPGVVVGTTENPQSTSNDSDAYSATFGLRGDITEKWNWEAGYTYSSSKVTQEYSNTVFAPSFNTAIAGGYDASGNPVVGGGYSKVIGGYNINGPLVLQPALDPFARGGLNPAELANVYGTEVARTAASLGGADAKVVGKPFSLPAGDVGIAVGVASRKETLSGTPDDNSYNASTAPTKHNWAAGATFFDPFSRSRTVNSYYAEARVPITSKDWNIVGFHSLDVSLAGRTEKYSDAGKSSVPKFGLVWQPYDEQFTGRFTYSKSFAAPFLIDEYGPPNYSFGPAPSGIPGLNSGVNTYSGNGNNPNLLPSIAYSHSFGVVFAPKIIKGLTASVDYINVFQEGFQAGIGAVNIFNSINALGSASPFFSAAAVGAAPGQPGSSQTQISAPGSILAYVNSPGYKNDLYILDHKINSGGVHQKAVDFNVAYALPTDTVGQVTLATTGTRLISTLVQATPGAPFYEFVGYSTNGTLFAGSAAKWSFYTTAIWKIHNFEYLVGNSFRSSMIDIASGVNPSVWLATHPATDVPSYTAWDTAISYVADKDGTGGLWGHRMGLKWSLGVTNIFDRMPPLAPLSYPGSKNNNNADVSAYSPIGRLFYASASVKF
jgi:iron complex outermembrane receptor protein